MKIPAYLHLDEALTVLSAKSGQTWTQSSFFSLVVDHALPMRSPAPEAARPVIAAGDEYVGANLPYHGQRLAVLSTSQVRNLWLHGETETRFVGLEPGEPGYLDWDKIKARRAVLNRSVCPPEFTGSGAPNGDWHDGEIMGECEVSRFSEVVRVTAMTCLVPRETIEELLAIAAKREDVRATLLDGMVNHPTQEGDPETLPPDVAHPARKEQPAAATIGVALGVIAQAETMGNPATPNALADLFDPVKPAVLERMFPARGKWSEWAERAARNGLKDARDGRAAFNPYRAALWFLQQGEAGWDLARCHRVLVNNLPARSRGEEYRLTGLLD